MNESNSKNFRLRTWGLLFIGVTLLIGVGILKVAWPYYGDQQVIAWVEDLDGHSYSKVIRPFWIPEAVDDEHLWLFERVYAIDLSSTSIKDADLKQLDGLKSLEWLRLNRTDISDKGLQHLGDMTRLKSLQLNNTHVCGTGFEHLQELRDLRELELNNAPVSRAGLEDLKGLTNLKELSLHNNGITHEEINELKLAMPNCEIFSGYFEISGDDFEGLEVGPTVVISYDSDDGQEKVQYEAYVEEPSVKSE